MSTPRPAIHFVSGLPRSGSTLLVNLLGQNSRHHVTPTNGLVNLVGGLRDSWMRNDAFVAQGLERVEPRVGAAIRGMMYGFYEQELTAGKVIFDKNRGWLPHIELLEVALRRKVHMLCTVRDVKEVVASFERLHRAEPLARRAYLGPAFYKATTIHGRAQVLLEPGGIVGSAINLVRDSLSRGTSDRVIVVPYGTLTSDPCGTLAEIHERLGLPPFSYDPENVEQITVEDDMLHGWGKNLHRIRAKVEPPSSDPWEVLPVRVCKWIDANYGDINHLASLTPST